MGCPNNVSVAFSEIHQSDLLGRMLDSDWPIIEFSGVSFLKNDQ